MMVVVFRSRLRPGVAEAYAERVAEVSAWATRMPGFVSIRDYTADDGERVAIVEFASSADLKGWAEHVGHRNAQQEGRDRFFSEYKIQVCELVRDATFTQGESGS